MLQLKAALSKHKYKIIEVLIAVGLLTWLVDSGRLDFTILFSRPLSIFHLLGIPILLVGVLLRALRWWWLLRAQSIHLSLQQAIQLSWIGNFFSSVLPGLAGGELVRAYYIAREASVAKVASVSTVLLDRVLGLYALLWLGIPSVLVLMILQNELTSTVIQMGALISMLVIGTSVLSLTLWAHPTRSLILGLMPKRFHAPLEATLDAYQAHGRDLLACFTLSLLAGIMQMSAFLLASQIIDTPLDWKQVFLVGPLVFIANTLPISPGGIGVAETAASVLFAQFGVETGASIMLIVRLWVLIVRLPGGLIYILRPRSSSVAQPVGKAKPPLRPD
jgi:uncharacterized membrane protein YbhN (UPF0104 family)